MTENKEVISSLVESYSSGFDYNEQTTAIILAAGHGKRIKSHTSKMLHKIWEKTTVERVHAACINGLPDSNIIVVVGIKAENVIRTLGKKDSTSFVYQENQLGTGHAVQTALDLIDTKKYNGTIFVLPGDMGLIEGSTINSLKDDFKKSKTDMMVLTGLYDGNIDENYYGRIVRAKGKNNGDVIEIIEYKDVKNMDEKKPYKAVFKNKKYTYTKNELMEIREYNSGVFAFDFKKLTKLVYGIKNKNVQKEIYLTDLISMFNKKGYSVKAVPAENQNEIMGFNNKSVLKEMNAVARKKAYDRLKDLIEIDDPDNFFIDDEVIDQIEKMDSNGTPLDIRIGRGAYIGKGAKLNYNLTVSKNVYVNGNISFGKNVVLHDNVQLTCFYGQRVEIGNDVEIFANDIIKGNVKIGDKTKIESGVRITGSDECPSVIGKNVTIKGLTYIFGSEIDDNFFIEHCVLINKELHKPEEPKGEMHRVKYYLPEPEGLEAIHDKKKAT